MSDLYIEPPPYSTDFITRRFKYDPITGLVTNTKRRVGYELNGYIVVKIRGRNVQVHKIGWFLVHGKWPREMDHLDRNGMNNRLVNLEPVTHAENNKRRWQRASHEERKWRRNRTNVR